MPDAITELPVTQAAIDKLGAPGISTNKMRRVPRNAHMLVRNPNQDRPASGGCSSATPTAAAP